MTGGGITGISGGEEQKVVVFARGDPASGSANANEPVQPSGPGELESLFGEGTPIVEQIRRVANNGVSYGMIWGVMPEPISVSTESLTGGTDGTDHTDGSKFENAPVIEDLTTVEVETDTGTAQSITFMYETNMDATNSDFTSLSPDAGEVFVNPITGEWIAGTADTYSANYEYLDWSSAFDAAEDVVKEQEIGAWGIDTESDAVISTASTKVETLRTNQWKMVRVLGLARPNVTGDDTNPEFDVDDYTDSVDDEATFLIAPGRIDTQQQTILGGVLGIAASNTITNPIIGDAIAGVNDLEQTLNVPEQETLEGQQVIPISNSGDPQIEGNLSTSTASDWQRTYFSRRIADQLILSARAVAKATRGRLNNENTETIVEEEVGDEIVDMIAQGVLQPNTSEDQRWYVTAEQDVDNNRALNVSFGFTPTGVVDTVTIDATINY